MRLRWTLLVLALGAVASARRPDLDFEFDDDADTEQLPEGESEPAWRSARPRRYVYDPHNALCSALSCTGHELCLLRAGRGDALCATNNDILQQGDVIVSGTSSGGSAASTEEDADDGDVFYEAGAPDPPRPTPHPDAATPARCVGCGGWSGRGSGSGSGGGFLCGSDNRTYSSLCRLDLHNCVRRPAPPVALACRGFCPCRPALRPNGRRRPEHRPTRRLRTDHDEWRRRKSEAAHNEVLPERDPPRTRPRPGARPARRRPALGGGGGGGGCVLDRMADRLLDWFSVLMEEAGAAPPPTLGFPAGCKGEVRWMFAHLDADADGALSATDLYALRHDERERCLRPFLGSCSGAGAGAGAEGGGGVSRSAWCACLARAARPCSALARAHSATVARARGGYVPACDARGYYAPRQCHAALGVCWCVDAHGAELPNSRTRGEPACPSAPAASPPAPEDDEDAAAGSGDVELHY